MDRIINFFTNLGMPHTFRPENLLEILILAFIIYELLIWVKDTRAWTLLRGIIVVVVFAAISYFLNLTTITWLFSRTAGVLITIIVIVFQPELRRALEQLGRNNLLAALFKPGSSGIGKESARSREKINAEIVRSVFDMSRTKTGALIIIEEQVSLNEYTERIRHTPWMRWFPVSCSAIYLLKIPLSMTGRFSSGMNGW